MFESIFEQIESNVKVSIDASDSCDEEDQYQRCNCEQQVSSSDKFCYDRKSCINVATQTECVKCEIRCCNQNFTKKNYAEVLVNETTEKGFGLFAKERIAKGSFIREFVGELINTATLLQRMSSYAGHLLVMELKHGTYIDATTKGSIARFLNHSCSPNCRIEVWNVNNCYRVGVFSLCEISPSTELTIDYEWEPSNKPLTKCYCKSKNCRGVIEKIDMSQYNYQSLDFKAGMWLSVKNVPNNAIIIDSTTVRVDPTWLVGKRVKVWWDGNQQYFDTDVKDYIPEKSKHSLKYLSDGSITLEELSMDIASAKWLWLDESRKEMIIKKKIKDDVTDNSILFEHTNQSAHFVETIQNELTSGNKDINIIQLSKVMKSEILSNEVAMYINQTENDLVTNDPHVTYMQAMQMMSFKFDIKVSFPQVEALLSNSAMNNNFKRIILYGAIENVTKAVEYIGLCEIKTNEIKFSHEESFKKSLHNKQSLLLLYDWRVAAPDSESDIMKYLLNLYNKQDLILMFDKLSLLSEDEYPLTTVEANTVSSCKRICQSMNLVSQRLSLSNTLKLHAISLYIRFHRFVDSDNVKLVADLNEDVVIVAAALIIAMKIIQCFKTKILSKLLSTVYSVVFGRDEGSCTSDFLMSTYCQRTNEKVNSIWQTLKHDLFICDIKSFIISNYEFLGFCNDQCLKEVACTTSPDTKRLRVRSSSSSITIDKFMELTLSISLMIAIDYSWLFECLISVDTLNFGITVLLNVFLSAVCETESHESLLNGLTELCQMLTNQSAREFSISISKLFRIVDFLFTFVSIIAFDDFKQVIYSSDLVVSLVPSTSLTASYFVSIFQNVRSRINHLCHNGNCQKFPPVPVVGKQHQISPLGSGVNEYLNQLVVLSRPPPLPPPPPTPPPPPPPPPPENGNSKHFIRMDKRPLCFANALSPILIQIWKDSVSQVFDINKDFHVLLVSPEMFKSSTIISHFKTHTIQIFDKDENTLRSHVPLGLVALPTDKQLQLEIKGKFNHDINLSNFSVSEINMLQLLHSFYIPLNKSVATTGCRHNPYFIQPLGIYRVSGSHENEFVPKQRIKDRSLGQSSDTHPMERLYLVTNPLYIPLSGLFPLVGDRNNNKNGNSSAVGIQFELDFLVSLITDVFTALTHCIKCGIVFKYLCLDQIFVSLEGGRIVFTGLDGAMYMTSSANSESIIKPIRSSGKSSKNSVNDQSVLENIKPVVSSSYLSGTAPEIVLGGIATTASSVFIFSIACAYILCGKPFIKPADNEDKYIQYVYKVLGTPKMMKYEDFHSLPRSFIYGAHIKAEDGSLKDNRSQVSKMLIEKCPQHLKEQLNADDFIHSFLRDTLCLVPNNRLKIGQIMDSLVARVPCIRQELRLSAVTKIVNYFKKSREDISSIVANPNEWIDSSTFY